MRRFVVFVVAAIIAILIVLATAVADTKGDVKGGKVVYDKKCVACHGPNGEGKPALAKALKVEIRDLGSKEVQAKSDEQLKKESLEGIGKMKPVTGIKDAEAADLIAYLRSLKK